MYYIKNESGGITRLTVEQHMFISRLYFCPDKNEIETSFIGKDLSFSA